MRTWEGSSRLCRGLALGPQHQPPRSGLISSSVPLLQCPSANASMVQFSNSAQDASCFLQGEFLPPPLGVLWEAGLTAAGGAGRPLVDTCGHNMARPGLPRPGPQEGAGRAGPALPTACSPPRPRGPQATSSGSLGPSGKRRGGFESVRPDFLPLFTGKPLLSTCCVPRLCGC